MTSHNGHGKTLKERFWEKVDCGEPSECWEWQSATDSNGYGRIHVDGSDEGAHRVSYRLEHGDEPGENWVLHHCDNKPCVNPNHLYLGDRSTNTKDAYERNLNTNVGSNNPNSKLSDEDIVEIRERVSNGETQYEVAEAFGIGQPAVSHIINNVNWNTPE